ncbi:MAG: transcription antitermination factor NusB [Spirochaetaceae bacterium]|nr:transcription antitermination factor NusB [Spirochaetaceae bacterium]
MASRRKARILAFQALYAWEASNTPVDELLKFSWLDDAKREQIEDDIAAFSRIMIAGAIENIELIDACIRRHLSHWPFERLKKVDLAILREGTYCLLFQKDIPPQITIDEAIEIAKEYGSEDSYKFINAVLDNIHKEIEDDKDKDSTRD